MKTYSNKWLFLHFPLTFKTLLHQLLLSCVLIFSSFNWGFIDIYWGNKQKCQAVYLQLYSYLYFRVVLCFSCGKIRSKVLHISSFKYLSIPFAVEAVTSQAFCRQVWRGSFLMRLMQNCTLSVSITLNESCGVIALRSPLNQSNAYIDCEQILPDAPPLWEETTGLQLRLNTCFNQNYQD